MKRDEFEQFKRTVWNTWWDLAATGRIVKAIDKVPYRECFEEIYAEIQHNTPCTKGNLYDALMNLRKRGLCPEPKKIQAGTAIRKPWPFGSNSKRKRTAKGMQKLNLA